jgi:hypothetical protein
VRIIGGGRYDRDVVALERAWRGMLTVLDARASLVQEDAKVVSAAADAVIDFIANHPGTLEAHVANHPRDLVRDWGGQRVVALFAEVRDSARATPHARMLTALSADGLMRVFASLWRFDHRTGELCPGRALQALAQRAAPATLGALELSPEAYDAIHALAGLAPLPDILPSDISGLRSHDVNALFEIYTGTPIADLEARLRGHGHQRGRFLADGESLAAACLRDAAWLARRRIDRHSVGRALAERFDQPSSKTGGAGTLLVTPGHVRDPFHTIDVYPVHGRGTADMRIGWLPRRQIPSMAIETIRRACFFGSSVSRGDPAFMTKWLELR